MCGIAGYINLDRQKRAEEEKVRKMTDAIAHRGPDGEGYFTEDNVALGHRRLSIIDLETGEQPMFSADNNIVLILNGEIYNYIELKNELIAKGYIFKTKSDTEVVIYSYVEWGMNCLNKFNGMWSFALFDRRQKSIFLARDRLGEKPLYYFFNSNVFLFGSEIKSLFSFGAEKIFNFEVLELYLTLGYIPAPFTFYKNIYKLEPGHYIEVKCREFKVKKEKYWDMPGIDENNMIKDEKKIFEEFEYLFRDSIKLRMRSDVPYGVFLSGGLDSTSVVSVMSEINEHPVETFTIGFEDISFDERKLANLTAKKFNCMYNEKTVTPDSFEESLDKIVHYYDEPFGDSSAIPTGYISSFAREKVKMVLTGDGGDEVLSGYTSYQGEKFASQFSFVPNFLSGGLSLIAGGLKYFTKGRKRYKLNRIQNVINSVSLNFNERLLQKISWADLKHIKALLPGNNSVIPIESYLNDLLYRCSYLDNFYKMMYFQFKISLPDDMLAKVDVMSMAYSLETRVPFLDYRLVEFMAHVDKNIKLKGYERKYILRNTIGKALPSEILKAHKKGFGIPLREWFKSVEFQDKLEKLHTEDFGLNKTEIKKIIEINRNGEYDFGNFIWMLFVLKKIILN